MNKKFLVIVFLFTLFLSACHNIVNLRPFSYSSFPSQSNQIIPADAIVYVDFHDSVNHVEAENAVEIKNEDGVFACDYSWQNERLLLTPVSPWIRGRRYTLSLQGNFNLEDGRKYIIQKIIPFYIESYTFPPQLESSNPEDEGFIGIQDPLVFTFTKPMDKTSFEKEFIVSPNAEIDFQWDTESQSVTITPCKPWQGLTRYLCTIPSSVTDITGMPIAQEYSMNFRTFSDTTAPELQLSVPWKISDDAPALNETLIDIDNTRGVYLEFNEAVDWDTWSESFVCEPSMPFEFIFLSNTAVVLLPEDSWTPEQNYTLTIGTTFKDLSGNALKDPIVLNLAVAISAQRLLTIEHSPADPVTDLQAGIPADPQPLTVTPGAVHSHLFTLNLACPISSDLLEAYVGAFTVTPVFPSTLSPLSITSVSLESPTRLLIRYSGFKVPDSASHIVHYYRFSLSADKNETMTAEGSYFLENWDILFSIGG